MAGKESWNFCIYACFVYFMPFCISLLLLPFYGNRGTFLVEFPSCMLSGVDLISRIARDLLLVIFFFPCAALIQVRYRCFNYCIYSKRYPRLTYRCCAPVVLDIQHRDDGSLAQYNVSVHFNHKAIREMAAEWR